MSGDTTPKRVIEVGDGFWNIRGSYRFGGVLDIGTQASLVRRASGKYVLLDACGFGGAIKSWLDEMTGGGEKLEAVIHLHPFHTVFAAAAHQLYPEAALYGTARHVDKLPELPWQSLRVEDPAFAELFAEDLELTIPRGVDFISANEKLHFSSVLALHPRSRTLHVDDTLMYVRMPALLRFVGRDFTRFHFTLPKVLERRAGAAAEFRDWARELIARAGDVDNLCAAHTATLTGRDNKGAPIAARIEAALGRVEPKLQAHEREHGA